MKAFCVIGVSGSGKTTVVENIIGELTARKYKVGSVKEIHHKGFSIDKENTDTSRHKKAGSSLVTARGLYETDLLYAARLPMKGILSFYHNDYVVLEGVTDMNVPMIITAHNELEIDERIDHRTFAVSGVIANNLHEYRSYPVINCMTEVKRLVDLIEEKVPEILPNFDIDCCSVCGYDCHTMLNKILSGEKKREDCMIEQAGVQLYINGKKIDMVPFVQNILQSVVMGVVKELQGYEENSRIDISMRIK